jgi:hypothetical protein
VDFFSHFLFLFFPSAGKGIFLKISGKIKMSKKANVGKKKSRMVVADSNCFHKNTRVREAQ